MAASPQGDIEAKGRFTVPFVILKHKNFDY